MEGFGPRLRLSDLKYLAYLALPMAAFLLLLELSDVMDAARQPLPQPKRDEGYQDLQALLRAQGMQVPAERVVVPAAPAGCLLTVTLPGACPDAPDGEASWPLEGGVGTCEAIATGWAFHVTDPAFRGTARCTAVCPAPQLVVGAPDVPVPEGVSVATTGPDGAVCEPPIAPPGG